MMQRDQLRRNQTAQLRAALDVVGFGDAAVERLAAQRPRVLLEASDQPRELAQFRIARELASEFEALARRQLSALAEFKAEIVTVLGDSIDFLGELARSVTASA